MRIAALDDDDAQREAISRLLVGGGHSCQCFHLGAPLIASLRRETFDLLILDWNLPDLSGIEVLTWAQKNLSPCPPVLLLTSRASEADIVTGLNSGADDYVVKPFSPRELVLRLRSVLKRHASEPEKRQVLARDGLSVDMAAHRVSLDGAEVALTATEFKLLAELFQSAGRVLTRDRLLNSVWGYEFEGYARTVDTHVRRLRQKLGHFADMIETVRGVGYRFKE